MSFSSLKQLFILPAFVLLTACGGGGGGGNNENPSDSTPNAFTFSDQTDVDINTEIESNTITVSGIDTEAAISILNGEYSIGGTAYTVTNGTVSNGQSIRVRQTSSGNFSTTTDATLTIGGVSGTFSVTTLAADFVPDAFSFLDQTDIALNTIVESNTITVTGINSLVPIGITGGEYSISGSPYGAPTTGMIGNGETVTVRQMSSGSFSTQTDATLTIGGVSDVFSLTSIAAPDTTPDSFTFTDQADVSINTLIESNLVTIGGIDAPAAISINGGEYSIDGAAYTVTNGTVSNGQSVRVRQTSSANFSTITDTTLTIGGVNDVFSVTTESFTLSVSAGIKMLNFSWDAISTATFYRFYENTDGVSGFAQVGGDLTATNTSIEIPVHLHDWPDARYMVEACNTDGCASSEEIDTLSVMLDGIGYFKASNTDPNDRFGADIAISGDGNTLAVSAINEQSSANGINGDQSDNSSSFGEGAVYVFVNNNGSWSQQAYIKPFNITFSLGAVSISDDGNTLVVGALEERSNATGVNGDETNLSLRNAGAAYVFSRSGTTWTQQAYLKASNTRNFYSFGGAVAISGDGETIAVGSVNESSNATGINGDENNTRSFGSGAVYIFTRSGSGWSQQAFVKASNATSNDFFGSAISLDVNGNTLAVSAPFKDGSTSDEGAAYIFVRNGVTWIEEAYIKASNPSNDPISPGDYFGRSISISGDGNTLAVGADGEDSGSKGVNGDQLDESAAGSGAVYVFARSGSNWLQEAYVKASNTESGDFFGGSVDLNENGNTLAVGAVGEGSSANGVNGDESDNLVESDGVSAGAVYVFVRTGNVWAQQSYVKSSNTESNDSFVGGVLSNNGDTLAVKASGEDSSATGVNGDQQDNSANSAGAVYLY